MVKMKFKVIDQHGDIEGKPSLVGYVVAKNRTQAEDKVVRKSKFKGITRRAINTGELVVRRC